MLALNFSPGESRVFFHALSLKVPDKHPRAEEFKRIRQITLSLTETLPGDWLTISFSPGNWVAILAMLTLARHRLPEEPALSILRVKVCDLFGGWMRERPVWPDPIEQEFLPR
jgi:hypothetical protein